ncbi:MAG TPA: GAF domain-containing protein [Thermoanaerobaculia bacterium]|nr:GAF domain-containing protein [Thermoanaerobaculia bacterium]
MRKTPAPGGNAKDRSGEVAPQAVTEERAFADAAKAILRACKTILGAEGGLVAVCGPGGKGLESAFLDLGGPESDAAADLPPLLRRLITRACKAGQTVLVNDLKKGRAPRPPPGSGSALESALLAPILVGGEVAGLVGLVNKPGGFSGADAQLAEAFAAVAAVAMLHGRTLEALVTGLRQAHEAEQRARYLADTLREATVVLTRSLDRETVLTTLLDRLRRMVPFDRASVMLVEEAKRVSVRAVFDGQRVVPLAAAARPELDPNDHPIVHGILTTGTPVLIPDIRSHPEWSLPTDRSFEASWLGVPLFARGNVAGLFSLSKREPGYFNEEHLRLAEAMSSQASVAVENAVLFEQMQASTARMQMLSRRLVEVQESERRHIARELHDEAGQALVSLRFGLRLLEREIDGGGSVTGRVAELMQRTDAVIDGLHRLAADLRPASLDHLGLEAALRQYSRSTASKFGLELHFKARGLTGERLPAVVETALYRVAQEAMTNVVRHAHATRLDVLVERRGEWVMVMVEDDGVGFEPTQAQRGDHFGLLGLRERAEALGGTLTVESAPGAGTTVVVEVPSADPYPDR